MKSLLLSLLFAVLLIFTACSDDNEVDDGEISAQIIGRWTSASVEIDDISINGEDLETFYQNLGLPQEFIDQIQSALEAGFQEGFIVDIEFKENGTYTSTDEDGTDSGTWELIDGDSKILFDKGTEDEIEVNIVSLTDTQFIGTFNEVENDEDFDEDGVNDEFRISVTITLNRA